MTYTEQQFLLCQRKRSSSLGQRVVGLFLPIRGTGVAEHELDAPTYLRRRVDRAMQAKAQQDNGMRLSQYVGRYMAQRDKVNGGVA